MWIHSLKQLLWYDILTISPNPILWLIRTHWRQVKFLLPYPLPNVWYWCMTPNMSGIIGKCYPTIFVYYFQFIIIHQNTLLYNVYQFLHRMLPRLPHVCSIPTVPFPCATHNNNNETTCVVMVGDRLSIYSCDIYQCLWYVLHRFVALYSIYQIPCRKTWWLTNNPAHYDIIGGHAIMNNWNEIYFDWI